MYHFTLSITTVSPPTLEPLLRGELLQSQPPRQLSDHLHRSNSDRKRRKRRFERGTKREKLLIYIPLNPWPPVEPGTSGSNGDTPISPSALPIRNNAGACHKPSWLMRGREKKQRVCVVGRCGWFGRGTGEGGFPQPNLGGVIWCMRLVWILWAF